MASRGNEAETTLSPDDAFSVLGNETRMETLQTLGEVGEPLSFSDLRDHIGMRDPGQFNYHLNQLRGHFIRQTDEGYVLREPGRRVIEAVHSGAVTEVPHLDPTLVDRPCPYCDAPTEVTYDVTTRKPVKLYCTECAGQEGVVDRFDHGQLGELWLSPAGLHKRSPKEVLQAAITWDKLEDLAAHNGICPRCTGSMEHSINVCENHDSTDGRCTRCDRSYAAQLTQHCTNCIFAIDEHAALVIVFGTFEMLAFLTAHGINPIADAWGPVAITADEEILSTAPFEARFTFTIDEESLTLTVDNDLNVTAVTKDTTHDSR